MLITRRSKFNSWERYFWEERAGRVRCVDQKERYVIMRARAIAHLGGACIKCGAIEDLEIDHIDRTTKSFDPLSKICLSWEKLEVELGKCQLLCKVHHKEKSVQELSVEHGGGLTGKKNCRCDLCRPLKNAYLREWKRNRRAVQHNALWSSGTDITLIS